MVIELKPIKVLLSPLEGVYFKGEVKEIGNGYHVYLTKEFKGKKVFVIMAEE